GHGAVLSGLRAAAGDGDPRRVHRIDPDAGAEASVCRRARAGELRVPACRSHEGHMSDPLERVLAELGPAEGLRPRESGTFDRAADGATEAVIFGGGALGRILLAAARASGVRVAAFADNKTALRGTVVDGLPVLAPADAVARFNERAYFLIGVFNSAAPMRQLRELGARRVVPYPAFYWELASTIPWAPGIELPSRIVADAAAMRKGYACLHDDKSRGEFADQIAWRCTLDYSRLPAADPGGDIYYAPELVRLSGDEVMVDCGAF